MIKQVLQAVQDELAKIESLRHVGEDWGQLHYDVPSVRFPCALIDVDGFNFEDVATFAQKARGEIYITVADQLLSKISADAPESLQRKAFEFIDLLTVIQRAINQLEVEGCDPLVRKSIKRVRRNDKTREYRITFGTEFRDEW